ncbi:MAG TPA: TonB-dependent receptor [Terriglobia bacterium]|nr:TonB-dependent receptor [Terriglobia bacterium]
MDVLTLLVFLFFSRPEILKGTILDPAGASVAGARVDVSRPGFSRATTTDDAGGFLVDDVPAGTYSLRVTAIGFAEYTSSIDIPTDSLKVTLPVAPHSEDVIVTTTRVETPLSMVGVSATILDREEIVRRQGAPVYELLRDVPGLAVTNTSRRGGTTSVYTRGGGKNANLLLITGVQINDPGGDFNFASLTPTNVERIEIVRGPQSASYGSNAAASVIQVVTHQGTPEDGLASGFASVEGGTFATYRYRTGISGTARAFDYSFAAEHLQTEGAYLNDAYRNLTFSTNTGYRLNEKSQLRLTLRTIGSRVGVPNRVAYGLLDPDAYRTGANVIGGARYERNDNRFSQRIQLGFTRFRDYFRDDLGEGPFNIGAIVSGVPGARGSGGVRLVRFLSPADLRLPSFVIPPGARLVLRTVRLTASAPFKMITERRTAEYQGNWNYSAHNSLTFGYDFEQERGITDIAPPLRNNHGLFANHQHSIGERLFLTESIRLEDNSVFHKKATPRFAVSYLLTRSTRLKASAGTGISEPSFLQSFASDPTFVGNRALRPERSRSFEAGIERHFLGSRLVLDETVFDNRFRDLIVFTPFAPPQVSTWVNLEGSRARGLESSARLNAGRIRVRGQYTLLDTRVTASASPASAAAGIGQELPRRPRHSGSLDVAAMFHRGSVNFNTTLVGERQDSDGVGFGIVRNPRYQKIDIGGTYALRPTVDLVARVENLLNRQYQEVLGYTALSRNALIGLNVRWGHR